MAAKKKSKKAKASGAAASELGLVLEDVRSHFKVFGEALQGLREHMDRRFEHVDRRFEHMDRRFESVERQLGLLTDAVRTHSKELQRIETRLDEHEERIDKLEGAAE